MSKEKNYYNGFMPMFRGGVRPRPFAPWGMSGNTDSAKEESENNTRKENMKSAMKSALTQRNERKKSTADNRREQWMQFFDYMMKMQDTFAASLPEDTSSLPPFVQMLPITPKAFMERLKKFETMANEHFLAQADSVMDFYFKRQEKFFDMISAAMDKKEEDEPAQTDSVVEKTEAEEKTEAKTVRKPRSKAARKTGTRTRKTTGTKAAEMAVAKVEEKAKTEEKSGAKAVKKTRAKAGKKAETKTEESAETKAEAKAEEKAEAKTAKKPRTKAGTKTGKKAGTKTGKKAKAEETAEDNVVKEAEVKAVEIVEDNAVKEAEAETVKSEA